MFYDNKRIKHWWATTRVKNDVVKDYICISFENVNLVTYVSYDQIKTFAYNAESEESEISYLHSLEFLLLSAKLNKYAGKRHIQKAA